MTSTPSKFFLLAFLLLVAGPAMSADSVGYPPLPSEVGTYEYPPLPTEYEMVGFDWDGFYAGVGLGGARITSGGGTETLAHLDAIIGVNVTKDEFLLGAELFLGASRDIASGTYGGHGGVEARAGYLIDQDVLIYAGHWPSAL